MVWGKKHLLYFRHARLKRLVVRPESPPGTCHVDTVYYDHKTWMSVSSRRCVKGSVAAPPCAFFCGIYTDENGHWDAVDDYVQALLIVYIL